MAAAAAAVDCDDDECNEKCDGGGARVCMFVLPPKVCTLKSWRKVAAATSATAAAVAAADVSRYFSSVLLI